MGDEALAGIVASSAGMLTMMARLVYDCQCESDVNVDSDNEEDSFDSDGDRGGAGDSTSDLSHAHRHHRWGTAEEHAVGRYRGNGAQGRRATTRVIRTPSRARGGTGENTGRCFAGVQSSCCRLSFALHSLSGLLRECFPDTEDSESRARPRGVPVVETLEG